MPIWLSADFVWMALAISPAYFCFAWKSLATACATLAPTATTAASVALLCADPMRHVLQDHELWTTNSAMYRPGCEHGDIRCLSVVGWVFLTCTYLGFACLIVGALWNADALGKLGREFRRRLEGDDADFEA